MALEMTSESKPLWVLSRKEMRARRRREWSETQAAKHFKRNAGTFGAASDCRIINPKTGECVGVMPKRNDGNDDHA